MKKLFLILLTVFLFSDSAVYAGISVAAGNTHTIMLKGDGTVWTWGSNSSGQLGLADTGVPTTTKSLFPIQVKNIGNIDKIDAGALYSAAIGKDGTLWTWGNNAFGQLGYGMPNNYSTAAKVQNISNINAIACGGYHTAALINGFVWCWGDNTHGQLGDGTNPTKITTTDKPTQVPNLADVYAIAAGANHSVALKKDDTDLKNDYTVWTWGYNNSGQLGNGQSDPFVNSKPSKVFIDSVKALVLDSLKAIAAGDNHTLALRNDGTVWAWGDNSGGQLGDNTKIQKTSPIQIPNFDHVIAIAAGANHTLALRNDGTVWAWGDNSVGQLGDNTTIQKASPIQIPNFDHVIAIAAGSLHSLAVREDGSLWAWGYNLGGQLGDKTTITRLSPVQVFMPGDINLDTVIDLKDAILSLQTNAGITTSETVYPISDVNGDVRIGIEETVYALQVISGLR